MANIKQAAKRARQSVKRQERNRYYQATARTSGEGLPVVATILVVVQSSGTRYDLPRTDDMSLLGRQARRLAERIGDEVNEYESATVANLTRENNRT